MATITATITAATATGATGTAAATTAATTTATTTARTATTRATTTTPSAIYVAQATLFFGSLKSHLPLLNYFLPFWGGIVVVVVAVVVVIAFFLLGCSFFVQQLQKRPIICFGCSRKNKNNTSNKNFLCGLQQQH